MGALETARLKNFSDDTDLKDRFLSNVKQSIATQSPASLLGDPIPGVSFPETSSDTSSFVAESFYPESDTPETHEEKKPQFHEIAFGVMSKFGEAMDLPEQKPIIVLGVQIQDPTIPMIPIINALKDLGIPIDIDLDFILSVPFDFLEAITNFLDGDVDQLCDLLIEMNDNEIPGGVKKKDFCESLEDILPISFPSVDLSLPELPTPPFIDLDLEIALLLQLELPPGILTFFIRLLAEIIEAMQLLIASITAKILEVLNALSRGIDIFLDFLFGLLLDLFSIPDLVIAFPSLFEQPGFVALFTTIIKYILGMIIIAVVGFLFGVGLIVETIIQILEL